MNEAIYIPRQGVMFAGLGSKALEDACIGLTNVCLRIPYKGYVISISCDDSGGCMDDLARSEIRVYSPENEDVTLKILKVKAMYATGATLKRAMRNIDAQLRV